MKVGGGGIESFSGCMVGDRGNVGNGGHDAGKIIIPKS